MPAGTRSRLSVHSPSAAAVPATTVTGPDSFGASSVVGTSTKYARQDHDHGLPANPARCILAGGYATGTYTTTTEYSTFGCYPSVYATALWTQFPYAGVLKNPTLTVAANTLSSADHYLVTIEVYTTVGGSLVGNFAFTVAGSATGVITPPTGTITVAAGNVATVTLISNAGSGTFAGAYTAEYDG